MKLYEIADSIKELENIELPEDGEDNFAIAIRDTLELQNIDFNDKVENCVKLIKNMHADAAACAAEEKRLKARKAMLQGRVKSLKAYVKDCMEIAGVKKVPSPLFSIAVQQGRLGVVVTDESAVPAQFKTPQPDKLNKSAMLDAGKTDSFDGFTVQRGESFLSIR